MQKLLFLLVVFTVSLWADSYKISSEDITNQGVDYKYLNPSALGNDGKYLIATERVYDIQKVSQGNAYNLIIFHFSNKQISKVDRISLKLYHLVNIAFDSSRDMVYVFGDHGNKIIQVSVASGEQRVVYEYKKGVAGFKSGPFVFFHSGKLYSTGWFFDENQTWLGDFVAEISMPKKDRQQFKRKASLDYLYKHVYVNKGMVRNNYYVSGDLFFFNLIVPEEEQFHLVEFRNEQLRVLAKGYMIYIFCGTEDRLFYILKNEDNSFEHYVMDLNSDKKWKIGNPHEQFTYPFLVKDKLVVTKMNYDMKTFSAYVGEEKENYALRRFIRDEGFGAMKVSEDGKYYFLMNLEGFQIGTFAEEKEKDK